MRNTILISMLVLFGTNIQAQKTRLTPTAKPSGSHSVELKSQTQRFSAERHETQTLLQRVSDPEFLRYPENQETLNLEPTSVTEKLDSLLDLMYITDSAKWFNDRIEYYQYDTKARNFVLWSQYYDLQSMIWYPDAKTEIDFNANNLATGITNFTWNVDIEVWDPFDRSVSGFDANGRQSSWTYYEFDYGQQTWLPLYTDTITYTGTGSIATRTSYQYESVSKIWNPVQRQDYNYDANDLLTKYNTYYWNVSNWENSTETVYFYDELDRDTLSISRYWDQTLWVESGKNTSTYDAAGNLVEQVSYIWDGESMYIGSAKNTYKYDANNRQIEDISYGWGFFRMDWFILEKFETIFDGSGNILEEKLSGYDTLVMAYTPSFRDIYEYDPGALISDIAMPYWWYYGDGEGDAGIPSSNKVVKAVSLSWNIQSQMLDSSSISYPYYSGLFDAPVDDANCKSDFSWRVDVADPQLVFFTDMSDSTVSSWYWIFGDGEISTERNPIHRYSRPGTYPVILATVDKSGFCNNTTAYQVKVGSLSCNAEFTVQVDTLENSISLDNASQGTGLSYFWNFGDGAVSRDINPTHQYDYPGAYLVTLTVASADGSCVDRYIQMIRTGTVTCNTDFVVSVEPETNSVYLRVTEPNPRNSYLWVLGDGTLAKDPSLFHTFSNPGEYSVGLSVSNLQNGCVETRREMLQVGDKSPGGKAKFIYVSGDDNVVSFTNHSIGDGLSYVWDFNDGSDLSTEKDPEHKYVVPGYYDVCLSVLNREGTVENTYCEKIFTGTDASKECLARFEYILSGTNDSRIRCLDRSFGNPDEWRWRYSTDGWIDRNQNTNWSAKGASYVVIHQTIKNSSTGCRDDAFALVNMGAEAAVKAGFGYVIDSSGTKANTYPVDFVGVSLGDAGKLKWDFGDGTFDSTSVNPVHVYEQPGVYKVCLTVINTTTGEEDTSCEMVEVGSVSSNHSVVAEDMVLKSYPNPFSSDTQVEIRLTHDTRINLALYDLMGRKLRTLADEYRTSGTHTLRLDGSDLEPGNYHLVLTTGSRQLRTAISIVR